MDYDWRAHSVWFSQSGGMIGCPAQMTPVRNHVKGDDHQGELRSPFPGRKGRIARIDAAGTAKSQDNFSSVPKEFQQTVLGR
eukprot:227592-Rhodomonas_salina.1